MMTRVSQTYVKPAMNIPAMHNNTAITLSIKRLHQGNSVVRLPINYPKAVFILSVNQAISNLVHFTLSLLHKSWTRLLPGTFVQWKFVGIFLFATTTAH